MSQDQGIQGPEGTLATQGIQTDRVIGPEARKQVRPVIIHVM